MDDDARTGGPLSLRATDSVMDRIAAASMHKGATGNTVLNQPADLERGTMSYQGRRSDDSGPRGVWRRDTRPPAPLPPPNSGVAELVTLGIILQLIIYSFFISFQFLDRNIRFIYMERISEEAAFVMKN